MQFVIGNNFFIIDRIFFDWLDRGLFQILHSFLLLFPIILLSTKNVDNIEKFHNKIKLVQNQQVHDNIVGTNQ